MSVSFVKKPIIYPLDCQGTLGEHPLTINVWVYFWTVNSKPLLSMSFLIPVSYSLDYNSGFFLGGGIQKCEFSNFAFLFQGSFGYVRCLGFPYAF